MGGLACRSDDEPGAHGTLPIQKKREALGASSRSVGSVGQRGEMWVDERDRPMRVLLQTPATRVNTR